MASISEAIWTSWNGQSNLPARSERPGENSLRSNVVVGQEIVGEGTSSDSSFSTPSAHAETTALPSAAAKLQRHLIHDGTLYSSSEPCPMCLTALLLGLHSPRRFAPPVTT